MKVDTKLIEEYVNEHQLSLFPDLPYERIVRLEGDKKVTNIKTLKVVERIEDE